MVRRSIIMDVLNIEPEGYSTNAIQTWVNYGFHYKETTWEKIDNETKLLKTNILIVRLSKMINSEVLDKFPNLSYLISATTGIDHIDYPELTKRNIKLISLREHDEFLKTIPSTAEHAWALLLALVRKIPASSNDVQNGNWNRDKFRGNQLKNKTLGIIGLGRTGTLVANYAVAFGMKVGYYDPYIKENEQFKLFLSLDSLLSNSDIVSIHVHLSSETKHLINESNITSFKPGSFLINTSRGKIIQEYAIIKAIKEKKIAGFATDVLYDEFSSNFGSNSLISLMRNGENIIITPHIAGGTWEAMHMCEEYLADFFVKNFE